MNKSLKIDLKQEQVPTFKALFEKLITLQSLPEGFEVHQIVLAEWYKKNFLKFALIQNLTRLQMDRKTALSFFYLTKFEDDFEIKMLRAEIHKFLN